MEESYIIYELFYYASEYIKKIAHTLGTSIWDDGSDDEKREWGLLETKVKKGA